MPIYKGANQITKVYQGETEIDKVYRGASKVYGADKGTEITVSGNPLVLTNVAKEKALDTLEINGKTEQTQLSGKNLFDKFSTPIANSNIKLTQLENGIRIEKMSSGQWSNVRYKICNVSDVWGQTINAKSQQIVSVLNETAVYQIGYADQKGENRKTMEKKFVVNNENYKDGIILLWLYANTSSEGTKGDYCDYIEPMIYLGTSVPNYEPYCGGIPSPNPAYPQEIVNVNSLDVVQSGKNLADYLTYLPNVSKDYYPVVIFQNSTNYKRLMVDNALYIVSFDCEANDDTMVYLNHYSGLLPKAGTNRIEVKKGVGRYSILAYFSEAEYNSYLDAQPLERTLISKAKLGDNVTVNVSNVQIEYGDVVTPYEPYKPIHIATIDGIELTKWDKIVKRNGVWGIASNTLKLDLPVADMNNSENYAGWRNVPYIREYIGTNLNQPIPAFYCNVNTYFGINTLSTNATLFFVTRGGGASVKLTQTEWKTNYPNLIVQLYARTIKEFSFIPLSQTIQDQLNALQIVKPTTVVTNNAECEMSATYLCLLDSAEAMLTSLYNNDLSEVLK